MGKWMLALAALVFGAAGLTLVWLSRPEPVPDRFLPAPGDSVVSPRTDNFDSAAAFALLERQVRVYGYRPAGSPASRSLARFLASRLPGGRLEPLRGNPGLRNVVGVLPGSKPAVVVAAHYDTQANPRGFVGANDGAAGTAAVVELARALARDKPSRGREIRFVLFDGEEPPGKQYKDFYFAGLRGSRDYAARHAGQVGQLVLLDYVAGRGLRIPREASSDPALWRRLRAAARRAGTLSSFPPGRGDEVVDDHTPFLRAGVPSVNLIDFDYPFANTNADNLSKVSERSLDVAGETVYQLVDELRRSESSRQRNSSSG